MNEMRFVKSMAEFAGLEFVARAIEKDEWRREKMGFMHFEHDDQGCIAVATDGRRLHTYRMPNRNWSGNYFVRMPTPSVLELDYVEINGYEFVDWKRVHPQYRTGGVAYTTSSTGALLEGLTLEHGGISKEYCKVFKETAAVLNYHYFADLRGFDWMMGYSKEEGLVRRMFPLLFTSDTKTAVIMPMSSD